MYTIIKVQFNSVSLINVYITIRHESECKRFACLVYRNEVNAVSVTMFN